MNHYICRSEDSQKRDADALGYLHDECQEISITTATPTSAHTARTT